MVQHGGLHVQRCIGADERLRAVVVESALKDMDTWEGL